MTEASSALELVLFDFDGTLVEFHHDYLFDQASAILEQLDYPVLSRGEFEEHFSAFDFFRFIDEDQREEFQEKFWSLFDWECFPPAKPFPGTHEALLRFRDFGCRLGLVTARIAVEGEMEKVLSGASLLEHISHIRSRPGEHVHWTDKRATILEICEEAGVAPSRTMMVGDIPPDITCAKEVGIGYTVAVLSGGLRREVLESAKPDLILDSIGDLCPTRFPF